MSFKQITFYCILFVTITITTALKFDGWIQHSSPLLPRPISHNAIGHNPSNHTIWLIGDYNVNQLISFDYMNNTFTDYDTKTLTREIYGFGQNYVQIGNTLYIADYDESFINSFNMDTLTFTSNYISTPLSFVGRYCCIISIRNEYIAVLGTDRIVQILNIESQHWLSSVPSMIEGRKASSCIYINDKMFIIGGYDTEFIQLSSIEYLNVSNTSMSDIGSMLWQYTVDSLPHAIVNSRCITVNDDILVIGGYDGIDITLDTIYIIQSMTGTVSLGGYLAEAVSVSAAIFVNNIVYSFGGYYTSSYESWDGWQTKALISITSTTTEPTNVISTSFSRASTAFEAHSTTISMIETNTKAMESTEPITIPSSTSLEYTSQASTTIKTAHATTISMIETNTKAIASTNPTSQAPTTIPSNTSFQYTTSNPILSESQAPTVQYNASIDTSQYNASADEHNNDIDVWIILVLNTLSVCVILILCGCIGVWIKKRRKKQQLYKASDKHISNVMQQSVELAEVKSVPTAKELEMERNSEDGEEECTVNDSMYDMEGVVSEPTMNEMQKEENITKGNTTTNTPIMLCTKGIAIGTNDIYMDGAVDA